MSSVSRTDPALWLSFTALLNKKDLAMNEKSLENRLHDLLSLKGPLIGSELMEALGGDGLLLWKTCQRSESLILKRTGRRYLRLDRRIPGFARLSPSILREFLTYTVIGLQEQRDAVNEKAEAITSKIQEISRTKAELAYRVVSSIAGEFEDPSMLREHACFLLAGDIVFNMAHDVPRPERSTKRLVQGSDMDIVVIVDDGFPPRMKDHLDEWIYEEKYRLLMTPHIREEIDYVVKTLDRVREQLQFDTFKRMVACKILDEGTLLYGSPELFHAIKQRLVTMGVTNRLEDMEQQARAFRAEAETRLMEEEFERGKGEDLDFFFPTEESEEFE
jgi:hypothetical protein